MTTFFFNPSLTSEINQIYADHQSICYAGHNKVLKILGHIVDKMFNHVDKMFNHVDKMFNHVDKMFNHVDKVFNHVDKKMLIHL